MEKSEQNVKSNKIRGRFKNFLYIFILIFSIVLLAVEGVVYYQKKVLTPFWVNGQSMYPTLNGYSTRKDGSSVGIDGGNAHIGDTVDYGVMNTNKSAIKKIKRFDVIVTQYSEDDTSNKIKRVVGMPGELVQFSTEASTNGDLYINGNYVAQPISTEIIRAASYPSEGILLGSDEYYVLGDNRSHSSDSRDSSHGPIKKEWITGKALYICGTAKVCQNSKGFLDIENVKYKWPKKIK